MSDRVFFDTNVLVYLFDTDSPAKQAQARDLLTEHARSGRIVLSSQVLQEFYVTVTRKLRDLLRVTRRSPLWFISAPFPLSRATAR
ncbi:MAG TPA: PIN domain-containing protein [Thermoanaerobaculia bacterium]|jgi:predicted nucleic acid-binding protein